MSLTIIQQPDALQPVPVRNPIEMAVETDNYLIFVPGQKTIVSVGFDDIYSMVNGNQFTVNCNGNIQTFTIVTTLTNENQILPRSSFISGISGSWQYGAHIRDRMNVHSVIGAKFQGGYYYAGFTDTVTSVEFTSIINEPLILIFTKISGSYTISNYVSQTGILDEYDNRPTILKIGMYFNAHGNPVDGEAFYMQIDGKYFSFYFRSSPNNLGYELPLRGSLSLTDYQDLLLLRLKGAPCFTDKFEVTTSIWVGEIHFTFTSIGYVQGLIINSSNPTKFVWVNLPGYQAIYQSNFTTNMRLYCEKNYNAGNFEKIIDLYSYPINEPIASVNHFVSRFKIDKQLYDFMNKTYNENLAEVLPYIANYPNAKHLLKKFYFRYNENYGEPATDKLIIDSSKYIAALYGIGHLSFVDRKTLNGFGFLHPSANIDNSHSLKQYVDIDQQCWLYFFIQPSDGNSIGGVTRIYIIIYYDDGTTYNSDITAAFGFNVPSNSCKTFFIPTGYNQRGVGNGNTSTKKAYMWDIIVEIDGDDYRLTKRYVLDCCSTYKSYLMYQNSYGGYDTVTITAPKEFSLDFSDGKEVERILSSNYSALDSQFEATIPKARQSVKANIGLKKSSDFDVLKDILTSKYVFILPKDTSEVFIPVNIDRKSVQLESEDDYEKTFSFEFSPAHEFKNFEGNLWLK